MSTLRVYILVMRRMRPYAGRLALAIAEVLLIAALEILKPWPLKIVIDNVLRGQPMRIAWVPAMAPGQLLAAACVGLVGLYLAGAVLQVSNNYLTISIGQRMVSDLRARLFEHLQRLSLSFHRRREIGDLLVRITYDTLSIQTIAMNGLFPIVSSGVLLLGMFAVMIRIDPRSDRDRIWRGAAALPSDRDAQRPDRPAGERGARSGRPDAERGPSRAVGDSRRPGLHRRDRIQPPVRRIEQRKPERESQALHFADYLLRGWSAW